MTETSLAPSPPRTSAGADLGRDWLTRALERFLGRPLLTLTVAVAVCLVLGAGLARVEKDPSVDAFVPLNNPAALAREEARKVFGLEDPIVVALAAPEGESVFTPQGLEALRTIHEQARLIPGVTKSDVVSLAGENAISGAGGDLLVEPILEDGPIRQEDAAAAWARVQSMPMMLGLLASPAGDMASVLIPVDDPDHAGETVEAVRAMATAATPEGLVVHIAGVAAMNARLAETVDHDTRIFIPVAVVTVLFIVLLALRSPKAVLGPLFVIAGSAAAGIGLLGWLDARYYLITTALPVVIMAIAVADCIHISTFYLKARTTNPDLSPRDAAVWAVRHTALPVILTSVTTMAGLIGLSFGAAMKPISEFGLFAAFGVAAACGLSLTALPAILVLTKLQPRPARRARTGDPLASMIRTISQAALARPAALSGALLAATALIAVAASQVQFDYERQRYFTPDDPIRVADAALNERLGGVNFLDVMITADEEGALMTAEALSAMQDLRAQIDALDHVSRVSGIDESISVMHRALEEEGVAPGELPSKPGAASQYMLLYEASAPPEDFRHEIDYGHRQALLRAQLTTDQFSATLPVVDAAEDLASAWSQTHGLTATVSGRVAVNDAWMSVLKANHFPSLLLAMGLVFVCALVSFRAFGPAVIAMLPLVTGILSVYAVMALGGIAIAPATSMTAAIASGLGIDFGIHLIAHIRRRLAEGATLREALEGDYLVVGKACLFSALALGLALAAICLSEAPPLRWFGLLISVGAIGSLFGALLLTPALAALVSRNR